MIRFITLIVAVFVVAFAAVQGLTLSREQILRPFYEGKAFKVISGIQNFDKELVSNVAWAANEGGASHIDIACDGDLVKTTKAITSVPVCVSSLKPADFLEAVDAGADMIEIGNFDGFYEQGLKFTAQDVINMTIETRKLLPRIPLSVTIPHTLQLHEQISLAQRLEECGADIIQTEGKISANVNSMGIQELIEIAAPTLAAAMGISRAVSIPVMCASGLTDITAPLALACGARGVGIGSMVNKLDNVGDMITAVRAISASIGRKSTTAESLCPEDSSFSVIPDISAVSDSLKA